MEYQVRMLILLREGDSNNESCSVGRQTDTPQRSPARRFGALIIGSRCSSLVPCSLPPLQICRAYLARTVCCCHRSKVEIKYLENMKKKEKLPPRQAILLTLMICLLPPAITGFEWRKKIKAFVIDLFSFCSLLKYNNLERHHHHEEKYLIRVQYVIIKKYNNSFDSFLKFQI